MQKETLWSSAVRRLSQRVPKRLCAQTDWTTQELQTGPDSTHVRRTCRGQDHYAVYRHYRVESNSLQEVKPKFHLARHVTYRRDSTRSSVRHVERVELVVSSRAVRQA